MIVTPLDDYTGSAQSPMVEMHIKRGNTFLKIHFTDNDKLMDEISLTRSIQSRWRRTNVNVTPIVVSASSDESPTPN